MLLKSINVNGVKHLMCCEQCGDDGLLVYYYNEQTKMSYKEEISHVQLMERKRQLNQRVQFTAEAVRSALIAGDPLEVTFGKTNGEQDLLLMLLKYRIEGAMASLKWEWQLKYMDTTEFYRILLRDALSTAADLRVQLLMLCDAVQKKDLEIKQYKMEGAQLRRSTVATEPFDLENFNAQNKARLNEAAAYKQMAQQLGVDTATSPQLVSKTETSSTAAAAKKTLSPRNRKRKALEISKAHLERKVLQRRRAPQLVYNDTQSQEDSLDECHAELPSTSNDELGQLAPLNLQFSEDESDN